MRAALVAEARQWAPCAMSPGWQLKLVTKLADALEAAGAERDAAAAAIERVRALETFSITDSYPAWTAVDHDELLAALDGALEPEPTDALALVEEVLAIHADRIGTHYEGCYKYHVACLAVAVKHRLEGEGK